MATPSGGNPYFVEYVALLMDLHVLFANGKGDSDAADAIRDKMDEPWRRLDSDETAIVRGLSRDLYTIGEKRTSPMESVPDSNTHRIQSTTDPQYLAESVKLLMNLHLLTSLGRDGTAEADAIRDAMADPWQMLSSEEQTLVDVLSADLYTIGENRPLPNAHS